MLKKVAILGLALALCACASEPRRDFAHRGAPRGDGGLPGEGPMRRPRLFISPSGEPFRGGDGLRAWFAAADADHDGALTLAEFQADAERFFRVLDVNGDGVIDGFEIQAYEQKIAPEISEMDFDRRPEAGARSEGDRVGMGGPRGGGRGGHRRRGGSGDDGGAPRGDGGRAGVSREGAARYSLINEPEPVTGADADVDGRVTLAEWRQATLRRFGVLDKAKTGRLTLETLRPSTPGEKPPRHGD